MKQFVCLSGSSPVSRALIITVIGTMFLYPGCANTVKEQAQIRSEPSKIAVLVKAGGPVVLTTKTAEFQVLPSGYLQALLLKDGQRLTLDEPGQGTPAESDYLVQDGKEVYFTLDFSQAKVTEAVGKLGAGKRVEIPAQPLGPSGTGLRRTLQIEA